MNLIQSSPLPNNMILAFVIGLLSYYISMVPSAVAIIKDSSKRQMVGFEKKFLWMPYLYGVVNMVLFALIINLLPTQLNSWYVLGAMVAILYSGAGNLSGLPQNVYEVKSLPLFHLTAFLIYIPLYGVVFRIVANNLC